MNKTHSKRLRELAEEILNAEKKAKDLYQKYVEIIKNESINQDLSHILRDEKDISNLLLKFYPFSDTDQTTLK